MVSRAVLHVMKMEWFGVRILGANGQTLDKLVLTAGVLGAAWLIGRLVRIAVRLLPGQATKGSVRGRKLALIALGLLATVVLLSIWFDKPSNLAVFSGLIGGGLAFASQSALLSIAGYLIIVFGRVFDFGDRIELGGVRGDVLDIGLFKTTIMEMGVPASLLPDPNHWVTARQYTGRVVTVVNSEVFKKPVFNYTANFDLLWEEIHVPVRYDADIAVVEKILLDAAHRHTAAQVEKARAELGQLRGRYLLKASDLEPRVYVRLTDNWIGLAVRFVTRSFGVRDVKDAMFRQILQGLRAEGIEVASSTVEIVHMPPTERPR